MSRSFNLFSFFFIIVLVGLGTWQLHRKTEKEALLNTLHLNQYKPPQNVDNLKSLEPFTPLTAHGQFIPNKTIYLQSKTHQGKNGVYVLDVFQTKQGQYLLVQRGWSTKEQTNVPNGSLKIEGIGRYPSQPNFFQPRNQPPTYFWIDLKSLGENLKVPLLPYYIVAKDSFDPGIFPTDAIPRPPNNHLEYAITWYLLAFLIGIMLLWKNRLNRLKDKP